MAALTRRPLSGSSRRWRSWVLLWLLSLLLVLGLARAWISGSLAPGIDFYQYWIVGQALTEFEDVGIYRQPDASRLAAIYVRRSQAPTTGWQQRLAAAFRGDRMAPSNTPFLYSLFATVLTGERDYAADLSRYRALGMLIAALSLIWLARALRFGLPAALVALAGYFLAYGPFYAELQVGNVNQLQLGLVCLFFATQAGTASTARRVVAGAVLGVAVVFKPNIAVGVLLLSLFWLAARWWRKLLAMGSGVLLGAGAAGAYSQVRFGDTASWLEWRRAAAYAATSVEYSSSQGNYALGSLVTETVGLGIVGGVLVALFIGLAAISVMVAAGRFRGAGQKENGFVARSPDGLELFELAVFFLGVTAGLLSARVAWPHYFILVLPLHLVYLAARTDTGEPVYPRPWRLLA